MQWEGHYKYFKIEATGLPAHVTLLYGQGEIKNKDKGKMKQKDNKGKQGGNLRNRLWLPSRKGAGKNKGKQNKKGKGGKGGKKGQGKHWQ